jgi:hypothetical protein
MQTLVNSICPQTGENVFSYFDFKAIDAINAAILEAAINKAECLLEDEAHKKQQEFDAEFDAQYWQNEAGYIAHNEAIDAVYFQQYK